MKHNKLSTKRTPPAVPAPNRGVTPPDFSPFPEEVARSAYFAYVNAGCPEGRAVQHWLEAEAQLIAERNRTRVHGFHNPT